MPYLKQSTEKTIRIGPFVDKTDGVTEETGLAGTGTEISKAGGAFAAGPVLGAHDADGWYPLTLTTTHTDTLGELIVKVHDAATHLPQWKTYEVVPANVYDALAAGSDALDVSLIQWLGTAPLALSSQLVQTTAPSAASVASAVLEESVLGHTNADTLGEVVMRPIATYLPAIQAKTDNLPTDPADQSLITASIAALPSAADVWAAATRTLTSTDGVKKNTELVGFTFFMRDNTDHVTGKTGLTVTATRSLDGAAFAVCTNAVTEIANGWYKITLAAADLTADVVALYFTATGADAEGFTLVTNT